MHKIILAFFGLIMSSAIYAAPVDRQNCVNPGGGCDGTVPCCNASVNACVRGRCEAVPRLTSILLNPSTQDCAGVTIQCSDDNRCEKSSGSCKSLSVVSARQ